MPTVTYPGVYVEEIPSGVRTIPGVPTSIAAFVGPARCGPANQAVPVTSFGEFQQAFGGLWTQSPMSYAVRDFFNNGGSRAVVVRVVDPARAAGGKSTGEDQPSTCAGAATGDDDAGGVDADAYLGRPSIDDFERDKLGLYALDGADVFNLLCIPPGRAGADQRTDAAVYAAALKYCRRRRAMLLVDPPPAWSGEGFADLLNDPSSRLDALNLTGEAARNAAVFFPRPMMIDPLTTGDVAPRVPCGVMAGVIARTDATRGVWKAPAGTDATLVGAVGLERELTDAEHGRLNPFGVNCLRSFPVYGRVNWGARTARGADRLADEFKYIPVRRLALFIEESLDRGLKWVACEPNDDPLWAGVRASVGAFMHELFRHGALRGRTPREAYFVKCDAETVTRDDLDRGVVNVVVGFAPLKPAEFVVIRLQQMANAIKP